MTGDGAIADTANALGERLSADAPFKVAVVQLHPRKGRVSANISGLTAAFAQLAGDPPQLIVLPESALTGYFLEGATVECALTQGAIAEVLAGAWRAVSSADVEIVCGYYETDGGMLYNSAIAVFVRADGPVIRHNHRKVFLPSYGVFDEARFVSRGRSLRAYGGIGGRTALAICEDMWHAIMPAIAALDGARMLIAPSASPARGISGGSIETVEYWHSLVRHAAVEHGMFVIFAGLAGSEGGKLMSGGSCIVDPTGAFLAVGPEMEPCIIRATIDPLECTLARANAPLVGALSTIAPDLFRATLARLDGAVI